MHAGDSTEEDDEDDCDVVDGASNAGSSGEHPALDAAVSQDLETAGAGTSVAHAGLDAAVPIVSLMNKPAFNAAQIERLQTQIQEHPEYVEYLKIDGVPSIQAIGNATRVQLTQIWFNSADEHVRQSLNDFQEARACCKLYKRGEPDRQLALANAKFVQAQMQCKASQLGGVAVNLDRVIDMLRKLSKEAGPLESLEAQFNDSSSPAQMRRQCFRDYCYKLLLYLARVSAYAKAIKESGMEAVLVVNPKRHTDAAKEVLEALGLSLDTIEDDEEESDDEED